MVRAQTPKPKAQRRFLEEFIEILLWVHSRTKAGRMNGWAARGEVEDKKKAARTVLLFVPGGQ
jgi:hypothetical protein